LTYIGSVVHALTKQVLGAFIDELNSDSRHYHDSALICKMSQMIASS